MDPILEDLFYSWPYLTTDRDTRLKHMEAYRRAWGEVEAAEAVLQQTLTPEQNRQLGRYTDALIAMEALGATASMLTGGKAALRLILSLLTA